MKQQLVPHQHRGGQWVTAMKAVVLVAAVWGVVYPALLWRTCDKCM